MRGSSLKIAAFLEQNSQIGEHPVSQCFRTEVRVCPQGSKPIEKLAGCRFFLDPFEPSQSVKGINAGLREVVIQVREMNADDPADHVRHGKADMMEVTAAEKGVGEVLLGIGGDADHRSVSRLDRTIDLDYIELHLVKNIEHVILKIGVGLVDLIDQ